MQYITHQLSNGLRIIHMPMDSPVSYCGFGINAGARDEKSGEHGLAHFVEHMLFKGTNKRRSWHILNRMENVGGELNAFTTKEETFVYSIFMEEHYSRAFELLADLALNSVFPQHEIEKEKDVIRDEINSYEDSPSELIYDEFENLLFNGHALGHSILGDEKTLSAFDSSAGLSFVRRHYVPGNMVFFSMGRKDPGMIIRLVEEAFGRTDTSLIPLNRVAPVDFSRQNRTLKKDTHQAHVILGNRSYSMYDRKRTALFLLNNMLGGPGMNSRLNVVLREKHGLAYTVESNIFTYTDAGMAVVYFGTDPKNLDRALALTMKTISRLCENKLTGTQLFAAKKQMIGQLGVGSDNKESLFLGLGKSFLHYGRYDSLPEVFAQINSLTAEELQDVANEIFDVNRLSCLIFR